MSSANLDQQALDRIAEEFSESIRRGEKPSIDDYVARYRDPSGQLRSLLNSIAMIEGIKQESGRSGPKIAEHRLSIQQLDDFRIVREIGRGGMGVVLEAIDQSLHRRVAIKVLPESLVNDPRNVDRFRRESKAAARLRHPGIVSVFGVGQAADYHYYVMDFIDGVNLRQWLDGVADSAAEWMPTRDGVIADSSGGLNLHDTRPGTATPSTGSVNIANIPDRADSVPYLRWTAEVGVMICDALHYAHSQGTLHRDIKPANLLIDRGGNVSITDFGLAKVAEHQPVTRTGDIVGTPQYMAPESFEGHYDVRSETYAVGLTLYELVTLRPAITAKTPAELIRRASSGISIAPRKLNEKIPRDLETIILKSLTVSPGGRYASAAQLRDDLTCFLQDLPISARRSNWIVRSARWSRREPIAASAILITFASLFALAVVSATAYLQTKSALGEAEQSEQSAIRSLQLRESALAVAKQQRQRAETNLAVAIEAFGKIREDVWQRGMIPDAEILGEVAAAASADVSPADAEILQSLLGFFDQLADNNSNDLRAESAAAGRHAGDIYQRLGKLDEANQAYSDALKRYRSLAAENRDDGGLIIEQARILNEQIIITSLQGQIQQASILYDQSIAALKGSPQAMSSAEGRFEYARAHALFASSIARAGVDAPVRRFRAGGRLPKRPGISIRSGEEIVAIGEAIDVLEELVRQHPDETKYHVALARAFRDRSKVAARAGMHGESEKAIKTSIDLFESLLEENKRSDSIRYELAKTLSSSEALGFNQMLRILRADKLSQDLFEQDPDLPRYQALRAHVLEKQALYRRRLGGKHELAEKNLVTALDLYDSLIKKSPDLMLYRTKKSQTLEAFSDLKLAAGDRQAAIGYLDQAIREVQSVTRTSDSSPIARQQLQRQRQKLNRIRNP